MINYNHLYYFYVTARLGGVSSAAEFLRISQPSLSSQLKVFENSLDIKLLEKRGRKLVLTQDGERAYTYAKKMFEIASDFTDSLRSPKSAGKHRLRIGITDQVERPFIADLLSPLIRDQKKAAVKTFFVSSAPTDVLLTQLRKEEIDLLLTNKPIYSEDVQELASASMPVNMFIATANLKDIKMRISRRTDPGELINLAPWGMILPSYKMKLRHEIDLFFQEIKIRKQVIFESDVMSVVGRAIIDGAGLGFMPIPYVLPEIKGGLLTTIGPKDGFWKHSLYLVGRKNANYDETIEGIRTSVKRIEKLV